MTTVEQFLIAQVLVFVANFNNVSYIIIKNKIRKNDFFFIIKELLCIDKSKEYFNQQKKTKRKKELNRIEKEVVTGYS